MGDHLRWWSLKGFPERYRRAHYSSRRITPRRFARFKVSKSQFVKIPEAPQKVDPVAAPIAIEKIDVKKIAENDCTVYVDGKGNVVSMEIMDDKGNWWPMPNLGTSKLRDASIYGKRSIKHPAKMNTLWAQRMIQEYSKLGGLILDPMAGIGTTGIEASRLGRNTVLVDYETKWVNEIRRNVKRLRKSGQMRGSINVRQGDSRSINLPNKVDVIMFSPPYGHEGEGGSNTSLGKDRGAESYGSRGDESQIGLKTGRSYDEDMGCVYQNCYRNLKPDGVMLVNVKDRVEDVKRVNFTQHTINLVEREGFKFVERKNVYAPPSVFRQIHEKKENIPHIRHEAFLVFQKNS